MATLLTSVSVKKWKKPESKRIEVRDAGCPGLMLLVFPSGLKSWAMRITRPNGKMARITLGAVDLTGTESEGEPVIGTALSLASARRLATWVSRELAMGNDVVAQRQRERQEREVRALATFNEAALHFTEQHIRPNMRRWQQNSQLLGVDLGEDGQLELVPGGVADRWRDRPIREINPDDVYEIVNEARMHAIPGRAIRTIGPSEARARKLHAALSKMFSWLLQHRRVAVNPCVSVHRPNGPIKRDRVLTDAELVLFWKACDAMPRPFGPCFRLMLLTAARRNEVSGMRRSELDVDGNGIWTLPPERTKNKLIHLVPLPTMALDILNAMRSNMETDFIFTTTGTSAISGWSKTKRLLDAAMLKIAKEEAVAQGRDPAEVRLKPWRLHDLRRSAATGQGRIGIQPHVIEACLNHVSGPAKANVAGIYNRYSYLPEKTTALERWAAHLEALVAGRPGANVVPLRAGA
jgi:integrase